MVVGRACAWISGMPPATVTSLVESLEHNMVCEEGAVRRDLADERYRFTSLTEALERSLCAAGDGATIGGDIQAVSVVDSD